jgi:NAD-dependent protein deacetylases, SIR2 family
VVGSTGEVYPAAYIPQEARRHGATIVEINVRPSHFTDAVTDIFLQGPAAETLAALAELLGGFGPASPVSRKAES